MTNESVFFSHMPRYRQIAEIIKGEIANGKYQPHDVLPSEPEMMGLYGVSSPKQSRIVIIGNIYEMRESDETD